MIDHTRTWHALYGVPELVEDFTMPGPVLGVGDSCYAMNSNDADGWSPLERAYPVTAGASWWVWRLRSPARAFPVGVVLAPAGVEEPLRGPWQPDGSFMMEVGQITFSTARLPIDEETYLTRRGLAAERDPERFIAVTDDVIVADLGGDFAPRVSVARDDTGSLLGLAVMTCPLADAFHELVGARYPILPETVAGELAVPQERIAALIADDAASPYPSLSVRDGKIGPRRWRG
ncbi:hypothetical protein [Miltoncostaea oceani]|uniref:hypothetical protein n=1 Tax=Miltoncostaea oceani TaxID=2843216 RepID=UPI001C3DCA0C|nr:hypothetical protein [Miltoncostaea oceani]